MSHCLRIILQFVLSSNFYLHGSVLLTIYESPYILQTGKGPNYSSDSSIGHKYQTSYNLIECTKW